MATPDPSPFRDLLGMEVTEWEPGRAVVVVKDAPELRNYVGRLHGGVVACAIDTAATLSGCRMEDGSVRRAITLSSSVNYIGAPAGAIRAVAASRGGGRKIFSATVEVFDEGGALVATGQGAYRYMSE